MIFFLIRMLFAQNGIKKALKNQTKSTLNEWIERALKKENYELAAYIKYYIEFKYKEKNELVL